MGKSGATKVRKRTPIRLPPEAPLSRWMGVVVRRYREHRNWSVAELAQLAGVTQKVWRRWEGRGMVRIDAWVTAADVLGITRPGLVRSVDRLVRKLYGITPMERAGLLWCHRTTVRLQTKQGPPHD